MKINWESQKLKIITALFVILCGVTIFIYHAHSVQRSLELAKSGSCEQLRDVKPPVWNRKECWKMGYVCASKYGAMCYGRRWKTPEELAEDAALPQIKEKAEQGDAAAQLEFAKIIGEKAEQVYMQTATPSGGSKVGFSAREKGEAEAFPWFRKAAEQGNAKAQNYLGGAYWYGVGVKRDAEEAIKWHKKAAEQGELDSQVQLYYIYDGRLGNNSIKVDHEAAAKWLKKAKENGYVSGGVAQ